MESERVLGFATVAPGNIEGDALPAPFRRALPRYPLPVLRLARMAIDLGAQSRGVGSALPRHVFLMALKMSQEYGCVGIIVDANPGSTRFYSQVGFFPLKVSEGEIESRPKPIPMFLPVDLIAAAALPTRTPS